MTVAAMRCPICEGGEKPGRYEAIAVAFNEIGETRGRSVRKNRFRDERGAVAGQGVSEVLSIGELLRVGRVDMMVYEGRERAVIDCRCRSIGGHLDACPFG